MSSKASIPVHSLQERSSLGLDIRKLDNIGPGEASSLGAHRDDHFIFIFQDKGETHMMIDFQKVHIQGPATICILPGQVHHGISARKASGWFLALNASFLNEWFRPIFENYTATPQAIRLVPEQAHLLAQSMELLCAVFCRQDQGAFHLAILRSLTDACLGLLAIVHDRHEYLEESSSSRPAIITRQFRNLVYKHFKTLKSPAEYAQLLNISPAYLNEAVKQSTGFPVSYWIQQEIIMEAKRLLYYTDLTVKEIAFMLGYEDHAYFSRLFSKTAGRPALQFRQEYRS